MGMSLIFQAIKQDLFEKDLGGEFADFEDYLNARGDYEGCDIHYEKIVVFGHNCYGLLYSNYWDYNDYYDYLHYKSEILDLDEKAASELEERFDLWWEKMKQQDYIFEVMV